MITKEIKEQSKWIVESTHLRMLPEIEKPVFPYPNDYWEMTEKEQDEFDKPFVEYQLLYNSQPTIKRRDNGQWKEGDVLTEGVDFEIKDCELCGGDGKETCSNPDHRFIEAIGGEVGRLGCPVCGHDDNHKVKNGGICDECNGTGKVAIPKQQESEEYSGSQYQRLFSAISDTKGTATQSEMDDIIQIVRQDFPQ